MTTKQTDTVAMTEQPHVPMAPSLSSVRESGPLRDRPLPTFQLELNRHQTPTLPLAGLWPFCEQLNVPRLSEAAGELLQGAQTMTTKQDDTAALTDEQLEWVVGGKAGGYQPGSSYVEWKRYMRGRCMTMWNSTPESNRDACSDYE